MIVTFPHLGPLSLALAQFFSYLKIPYLIPPDHGDAALEAGSKISPEEMCMPFKMMAGNLKSAYDAGADTAIMLSTCGPCRLGEYGQLLIEVLQKDGCDFKWVLLDSPADIGMTEFIRRFHFLTNGSDRGESTVINGFRLCMKMIQRMDSFRRKTAEIAGYLSEPCEAVKLLQETNEELRHCSAFSESFRVIKQAEKRLKKLKINDRSDPVKLLIVGEIYTSIEEEGNRRLEEKLMRLGCSVERHIDLSWWVRYSAKQVFLFKKRAPSHNVKEGIPCNVGGYARETAEMAMKSKGHDGIIKIMPSGCMPEIVAKAFCEELQNTQALRILHLIFDEMSGDAGYDTRIEAFVDMLERRKNVLAGD